MLVLLNQIRIIISILAIAKTKIPNIGPTNAILNPPANILGASSPAACTVSKAFIKPIVLPKNPHATANQAIEEINLIMGRLKEKVKGVAA